MPGRRLGFAAAFAAACGGSSHAPSSPGASGGIAGANDGGRAGGEVGGTTSGGGGTAGGGRAGGDATAGAGVNGGGGGTSTEPADAGTAGSRMGIDAGAGASSGDCATAPPMAELARWFRADTGIQREGAAVTAWFDPRHPGDAASGASGPAAASARPQVVAAALNGHDVVEFDGDDDQLTFVHPLNGRRALTIVAVAATTRYKQGIPNTCCPDWVRGETGASATSNLLVYWPETAGAGSVLLSPQQTEVAMRFGTAVEWTDTTHKVVDVSNSPTDLRMTSPSYKQKYLRQTDQGRIFDANGQRVSVGDHYTFTMATFAAPVRRLYVEGKEAMVVTDPNDAAIAGTDDTAFIGRGRFPDFHWPGRLAELLVYDAALDDAQRSCIATYVRNRYGQR